MKRLGLALAFLLFASVGASAQTTLNCYNSNSGFSTTQPCPGNKTTTNASATITTGNTFQTVLGTASNKASITIENNNATDSCWIAFGKGITSANATKAESILLLAGGSFQRYFPYVPSDEIEGTCASNSDTIYVDYQN